MWARAAGPPHTGFSSPSHCLVACQPATAACRVPRLSDSACRSPHQPRRPAAARPGAWVSEARSRVRSRLESHCPGQVTSRTARLQARAGGCWAAWKPCLSEASDIHEPQAPPASHESGCRRSLRLSRAGQPHGPKLELRVRTFTYPRVVVSLTRQLGVSSMLVGMQIHLKHLQ